MPRRRFKFDYDPNTEALRRYWEGFPGLVHKAMRGEPQPLIDYFEQGEPRQLSAEDCSTLAWLLSKKLSRPAHRPRGSLKDRTVAIQAAKFLLREGKKWHRRQHVASNRTVEAELLEQAVLEVSREMPNVRFTADDVKAFTAKPRQEVVAWVCEYLRDAFCESIALRRE
jgi:hypothetical protein